MTLWKLKNPHTMPMIVTLLPGGSVLAEFPGGCIGVGTGENEWQARDEAILHCAEAIVAKLKGASHVAELSQTA